MKEETSYICTLNEYYKLMFQLQKDFKNMAEEIKQLGVLVYTEDEEGENFQTPHKLFLEFIAGE